MSVIYRAMFWTVLGLLALLGEAKANEEQEKVALAAPWHAQDRRVGAFQAEFMASRNMEGDSLFLPSSSLTRLDGRTLGLKNLAGKIVVVNYWATWCGPCVGELGSLQKLLTSRPDIQLLAVSLDEKKNAEEHKTFLLQQGLPESFPVYFDTQGDLRRALPSSGLPTSYVIGKSGKILYKFIGDADWSSARALAFFEYLGQPTPSSTRGRKL